MLGQHALPKACAMALSISPWSCWLWWPQPPEWGQMAVAFSDQTGGKPYKNQYENYTKSYSGWKFWILDAMYTLTIGLFSIGWLLHDNPEENDEDRRLQLAKSARYSKSWQDYCRRWGVQPHPGGHRESVHGFRDRAVFQLSLWHTQFTQTDPNIHPFTQCSKLVASLSCRSCGMSWLEQPGPKCCWKVLMSSLRKWFMYWNQ